MKAKLYSLVGSAIALLASSLFLWSCQQAAQSEREKALVQQEETVTRQYSIALEEVRHKVCPSLPADTPPNLFADACSKAVAAAKTRVATAVARPALARPTIESNVK